MALNRGGGFVKSPNSERLCGGGLHPSGPDEAVHSVPQGSQPPFKRHNPPSPLIPNPDINPLGACVCVCNLFGFHPKVRQLSDRSVFFPPRFHIFLSRLFLPLSQSQTEIGGGGGGESTQHKSQSRKVAILRFPN